MAGHCSWVLVWAGACYWHGVGGFVLNSPSSPRTAPHSSPRSFICCFFPPLCAEPWEYNCRGNVRGGWYRRTNRGDAATCVHIILITAYMGMTPNPPGRPRSTPAERHGLDHWRHDDGVASWSSSSPSSYRHPRHPSNAMGLSWPSSSPSPHLRDRHRQDRPWISRAPWS